jgi:hypothetical protein
MELHYRVQVNVPELEVPAKYKYLFNGHQKIRYGNHDIRYSSKGDAGRHTNVDLNALAKLFPNEIKLLPGAADMHDRNE